MDGQEAINEIRRIGATIQNLAHRKNSFIQALRIARQEQVYDRPIKPKAYIQRMRPTKKNKEGRAIFYHD